VGGERVDELGRRNHGGGVVWNVHVEGGMHFNLREIGGHVLHHGYLIAEFCGISDCCLHARMCHEPDDDELMDAVFVELQIQIGVGEAAGGQ